MREFENNKRIIGKTKKEKYSPERLNSLKRLISNFEQQGRRKYFSIAIDNEVVIPRTDELEQFDLYMDYMDTHTKLIDVRLYFGESFNSNRYLYFLNENELNGFENNSESKINEMLEKKDLETRIYLLEKKLKRKKKQLKYFKSQQTDEKETPFDLSGILNKGAAIIGSLQNQEAQPKQMEGVKEQEVQIEHEQSQNDLVFQRLKEIHSEQEITYALRVWEIIIKNPNIQQRFNEILKEYNHGKA